MLQAGFTAAVSSPRRGSAGARVIQPSSLFWEKGAEVKGWSSFCWGDQSLPTLGQWEPSERWERRKPGLGRSLGTVRGMAQSTGEAKQWLWERADLPAWKEMLLHLFFPTSGCLPRSCPGHAGSSAGPCSGKEVMRELRQRRG